MNSSQFMDKQILGLAATPTTTADFLDLAVPPVAAVTNDDIIASYDFQPIRIPGSSPPATSSDTARSGWGSVDSKLAVSNLKHAGISEPRELTKVCREKERSAYDAATVAEIDRTVKKYVEHIIQSLDDVSSRLSQMESRTHHLESTVDELKVVIGNNNGATDGKLRQLQNVLREVQTGIQVMRDKQEIAETQLQLAKLQSSEGDHQTSEKSNVGQRDSRQAPPLPPQQSVQQTLQSPVTPQQPSALPAQPLNASPRGQQNQAAVQFPGQLPQNQVPSPSPYYAPPAQLTDASHQQYHIPAHNQSSVPQPYQSAPQLPQLPDASQQQYQTPPHQHQPPPPQPYQSAPPQPYQSAPPLPQYPQPPPPQHPQLPHNPEDSTPYAPPTQSYPPSIRQQSSSPLPPGGNHQQFYGPNPGMYEPSSSRASGQPPYTAGYGQQGPPSFSDPYPYGSGSPSHYSSSQMKPSPFSSSTTSSGGGSNNYQRLPTAQILPQAQSTGPAGAAVGNRVPVDDVVDKVVTMGFSRDQVRATVRKLTENGQAVDLNVVLDKLMNGSGEMIQPQKGWFGR